MKQYSLQLIVTTYPELKNDDDSSCFEGIDWDNQSDYILIDKTFSSIEGVIDFIKKDNQGIKEVLDFWNDIYWYDDGSFTAKGELGYDHYDEQYREYELYFGVREVQVVPLGNDLHLFNDVLKTDITKEIK